MIEIAEMTKDNKELIFNYTNWRGDHSVRRITPVKIWFGTTEWHQEHQWFLQGTDLDKGELRDFSLKDIVFIKNR
ncbi:MULTISPECIES: WYL domain-containing protein [unclassified Mesorhizobium]|uniref:WYL domain-containing protein n=1 Tax=unclassified Mesorhizobium TaxID=325217 RepID=UPI001CCEB3F2|nr:MULTISPECIES: WYL domain-containing protein [unclassified Mesorhizobium]MBZ9682726.1 WYL domain-containing protein [Mesorhizobium sp. CO1-1-2]MBZ9923854.1 WYL domain-containing protein [Mesorhizobium sp. BR1-1-4]